MGDGDIASKTSTGRPGDARFSLPPKALVDLRNSIADSAGPAAADEVLFRLGRNWGESEARALGLAEGDPRAQLERGLARAHDFELGEVRLDVFESSPAEHDCRVRVRVVDPLQEEASDPEHSGAACGLTLGFATGVVATVTGLDVVSTPFQCAGCCDQSGCAFEIRPAHTWTENDDSQPPSGSARFFLQSLGPSLSGGDISLSDLVEHTGDAIVLIDAEDVIRFWNRGAEEMFGYMRDEVVGRKVGFIVPEDLLVSDELGWIQKEIEKDGVLTGHVTRRVHKDGTELAVNLTRTMLRDGEGRAVGSTTVIRDVTSQVEAEKELSKTNHLARVGELAATVAHEIKNPLTGIYAGIQILSRSLAEGDERKHIFDDIANEIRRLDQIAKDLIGFSRPTAPKLTPTPLLSFLQQSLQSPGLAVEIERHELDVKVDEGFVVPMAVSQMLQIVQNIVLNACQAMKDPGVIRIEATEAGGVITLAVQDSGPGIPPDRLEAIFDPFVSHKARGTGLGLSVARKNVEAHHGKIRAENAPSGGARFVITLPSA